MPPEYRPQSDHQNDKIEEVLNDMLTLFSSHNTMSPFWNDLDFDRKQNIRYEMKLILDKQKPPKIKMKTDN